MKFITIIFHVRFAKSDCFFFLFSSNSKITFIHIQSDLVCCMAPNDDMADAKRCYDFNNFCWWRTPTAENSARRRNSLQIKTRWWRKIDPEAINHNKIDFLYFLCLFSILLLIEFSQCTNSSNHVSRHVDNSFLWSGEVWEVRSLHEKCFSELLCKCMSAWLWILWVTLI